MTGCACPHPAEEHAPREQFGQAICLHPGGCDCNGTHEEVIAAYVQRNLAKRRVLHDLCDMIRDKSMCADSEALDIATAILEKYELQGEMTAWQYFEGKVLYHVVLPLAIVALIVVAIGVLYVAGVVVDFFGRKRAK